jgi:hypothetical protein
MLWTSTGTWADQRISRFPENITGRKAEGEVGDGSKMDELKATDAGAHWSAETGGRGCRRAFQRVKLNGRRVLSLNRARQPQHRPGQKEKEGDWVEDE